MYIIVNLAYSWGVYTNNWGVYTNVNMDYIDHPCYVEQRDKRGRIRKPILSKLDLEDNLEGFIFEYRT